MSHLADQLPPEIAQQLHPDRRKNEAEYWAVRDQLLDQYRDQWVGFADGTVIASGTSPVAVFHAAEASGRHPFFICVGREQEPCRIRRETFPYDTCYSGEALPLIGGSRSHAPRGNKRNEDVYSLSERSMCYVACAYSCALEALTQPRFRERIQAIPEVVSEPLS